MGFLDEVKDSLGETDVESILTYACDRMYEKLFNNALFTLSREIKEKAQKSVFQKDEQGRVVIDGEVTLMNSFDIRSSFSVLEDEWAINAHHILQKDYRDACKTYSDKKRSAGLIADYAETFLYYNCVFVNAVPLKKRSAFGVYRPTTDKKCTVRYELTPTALEFVKALEAVLMSDNESDGEVILKPGIRVCNTTYFENVTLTDWNLYDAGSLVVEYNVVIK